MTAPLTVDQLDLIRHADSKRLSYRPNFGYLLDGVLVDAGTQHIVNDLIVDGWLYLPGMYGPGEVVPVRVSDQGSAVLS